MSKQTYSHGIIVQELQNISEAIIEAGGEPFVVGGCVRDSFLEIDNKDYDVEVFGLSYEELVRALRPFGRPNLVGASFGVTKLRLPSGIEVDISLPRRDNKVAAGTRGFEVEFDAELSPEEAAARRDFTINAMSRSLRTGDLVDPYRGQFDLEDRLLRHTSDHFAEDPLRVLRGFQFCGRFGLVPVYETAVLCKNLLAEFDALPVERIWGEWYKWAAKSVKPSLGLDFLKRCGWLAKFPELAALDGVPQDSVWHPEGGVWLHTLHVCDAAAEIAIRECLGEEERVTLVLAALCHDLGKPDTTVFSEGHWRSPGHCEEGVPIARKFLKRIGCFERIIEVIEPLVAEHLVHVRKEVNPRIVRRLSNRLGKATIKQLMLLVEADMKGRPPLPGGLPEEAKEMLKLAEVLELESQKPRPLIGGKHLIDRGYQPGPNFKKVLSACFEAQLDGEFEDEESGVIFLEKLLAAGIMK